MGAWDLGPWGNDKAASWLDDVASKTALLDRIELALREEVTEEGFERTRAAACLTLLVGRALGASEDLTRLAASRLKQVMSLPLIADDDEYQEQLADEVAGMEVRLEGGVLPQNLASRLLLPNFGS